MKQFDKYEKRGAYHWHWYDVNKEQYKDRVHLMLAHLPTSGTLLDIGGGDGLVSYLAFRNGLQVTCVDSNQHGIKLAQQMVEQAVYGKFSRYPRQLLSSILGRRKPELVTRYENGELRFIAQSVFGMAVHETFDYAICHEVIEHVPEPANLLDFVAKNVKHFAIISTPDVTHCPPHELDYNNWTPETFSDLLSGYRFEFILRDGSNMYVKLYCEA